MIRNIVFDIKGIVFTGYEDAVARLNEIVNSNAS